MGCMDERLNAEDCLEARWPPLASVQSYKAPMKVHLPFLYLIVTLVLQGSSEGPPPISVSNSHTCPLQS